MRDGTYWAIVICVTGLLFAVFTFRFLDDPIVPLDEVSFVGMLIGVGATLVLAFLLGCAVAGLTQSVISGAEGRRKN